MGIQIRSDLLSSNRINVLIEDLDPDNIVSSEWPSDLHLVEYVLDGRTHYTGIRAHTMVDIFDCMHDHLNPLGGHVVAIRSGLGTIKPKLWTAPKS